MLYMLNLKKKEDLWLAFSDIGWGVYSFGDTISSVMSGGAVSRVATWDAICWSFSGNGISSVTSEIPGSVSPFSEEYIVYVYFKSYIDLCAANKQKIMTKSIWKFIENSFLNPWNLND